MEKWTSELPIPVIPRECVTDLANDPIHLLCRAVLLSLPMWAVRYPIDAHHIDTCHELDSYFHKIAYYLKTVISPSCQRNFFIALTSLCRHLIEREIRVFNSDRLLLSIAMIEWLGRSLLRDTRTDLATPFLNHFINGEKDIL